MFQQYPQKMDRQKKRTTKAKTLTKGHLINHLLGDKIALCRKTDATKVLDERLISGVLEI